MKIAVFVEGLTEVEFVKSLIYSLCGRRSIHLEIHQQHEGLLTLQSTEGTVGAETFILLINCKTDNQVKTQIVDNYSSLVAANYSHIIGLRDIYPDNHSTIPRYKAALKLGLPTGTVPISMHLSILEIEAWFLDELTHFERIDPLLTISKIVAAGFDISNNTGNTFTDPADTLCKIYRLVGKAYRKKGAHILRTVQALSQEELYVNVRARAPEFNEFVSTLETALF